MGWTYAHWISNLRLFDRKQSNMQNLYVHHTCSPWFMCIRIANGLPIGFASMVTEPFRGFSVRLLCSGLDTCTRHHSCLPALRAYKPQLLEVPNCTLHPTTSTSVNSERVKIVVSEQVSDTIGSKLRGECIPNSKFLMTFWNIRFSLAINHQKYS